MTTLKTSSRRRQESPGSPPTAPADAEAPEIAAGSSPSPAATPADAGPVAEPAIPEPEALLSAVLNPVVPRPDTTRIVLPGSDFCKHDIVQIINDLNHRNYGMFLIVGDYHNGKVHGYYITEGGKRNFLTVDIGVCHYIGVSKVRAQVCCSPKWLSDHGRT